MPSIYAADVQLGKPKKIASDDAYKENVAPTKKENIPPTDKPKRTLSEETKQKLKEARERKKQERLDAAKQAEEAEQAERDAAQQAEQAAQAKKEAAAAKRREARLKRKASAGPVTPEPSTKEDSPISDAPAADGTTAGPSKPKRQRKAKVETPELSAQEIADTKKAPGDQPPQWFTKFVTTIMTEKKEQEGVKASKRELKVEGEKAAEQKWADSYTRDRIRNAVDGHLGQMYSMIFR